MLSCPMQDEFIFTALEYAKMHGISKDCLRKRRKAGKLEGEYTVKSNCYFYKRPRPNQERSTPKIPPQRVRRRGAHLANAGVRYPNTAFRNHNEAKMLAKLKYNIDDETLSLLPEAIQKAKDAKAERIKEVQSPVRAPSKGISKNYCSGLYTPGTRTPNWKPLDAPVAPKREFKYY